MRGINIVSKGNILTVTTISRTNEAFLVDITRRLTEFGHFAAASDITGSPVAKEYQEVFDLPMQRAMKSILNIGKFRNLLIDRLIEHRIDIVHVHTPVAAFMVRYALKDRYVRERLNVKVIYTAHGFHFFAGNALLKNLLYGALEFLASRWTDRLVVINKTDEQVALKLRLLPPGRIIFMPGIGVDLVTYRQSMPSAFTEQVDTKPYFLVVAEFIPRKRHRDVLQALSLTLPEFDLYLAGDGVLQEELRHLVDRLSIADRVHFLGHRSDVPELMQKSLANILVSSQEGLPRSVLEAMALNTLVIGSRIRGTVDLLEDGRGVLVDVGDFEALAREMMAIARSPEKYEPMKRAAQQKIQDYGLDHIVELHRALYGQLLSGKNRYGEQS